MKTLALVAALTAVFVTVGCSSSGDMSASDKATLSKSLATPLPKPPGAGPQKAGFDPKQLAEERAKRLQDYQKSGKMSNESTSAQQTAPPKGGE